MMCCQNRSMRSPTKKNMPAPHQRGSGDIELSAERKLIDISDLLTPVTLQTAHLVVECMEGILGHHIVRGDLPDMALEQFRHDFTDFCAFLGQANADGASVDGILSERDIVRELGKRGGGCLDDAVSSLMTNAVIACHPGDSVLSVLEKMTDGRFRHMPVIEDGAMIGVVSIGDAVKARIDEVESENSALTDMIAGTA